MRRPLLGLDVDGVVANFIDPVIRLGLEMGFGEDWPRTAEEWTSYLNPKHHDRFKQIWDLHCRRDSFWLTIPSYPDARTVKPRPDFYVTARACTTEVTARWMALQDIPSAPIITVPEGTSKVEAVKKAAGGRSVVFVEDHPDHQTDLEQAGVTCFLLDRPWNRTHQTMRRLASLDQLEKSIKHLIRKKLV
jgi:hypothetical protein